MAYKKKLIEVALPLEAINAASVREKSIRHGHPSTLHLWWARRPLAAARAVIFSSLVDDPSSNPEEFPTEKEQDAERQRLFALIEKLVKWENTNNQEILNQAKAEIMKSTAGNPPALLDPFAGGGTIPLEAQRLGLVAHASDLNPVAVMINKAMIEIPPKFAGQPPVNPAARVSRMKEGWKGAAGLAEDVRYYGEWMKQEAFKRIGHLYPKVKVPKEQGGGEATVIAWIWARTVKCPNPACGCEMPLASTFVLSKKAGKQAYVQPVIEGTNIRYTVKNDSKKPPDPPKTARGAKFKCIKCGEATTGEYIRQEAVENRMGDVLMAVIAEGNNERVFITPDEIQFDAANMRKPQEYPSESLPYDPRNIWCVSYGMDTYDKLFANRQLSAMLTFSGLVAEAHKQIVEDGGTPDYATGVCAYLACAVDRLADYCSKFATWSGEFIAHTFGRQALPMVWDYAECNPFSNSTGNWTGAVDWIVRVMGRFPLTSVKGHAKQMDAQSDNGLRGVIVSTDPPYYDNIAYANLADYFYVWLRNSLKSIYPDVFHTLLTPKAEELVAAPYRFDGSFDKAKEFFEDGLLNVFKKIFVYSREDTPITVYYAFKQSESDRNDVTASTGWETMLSAIIKAGYSITGTWPMRTERTIGLKGSTNMLASSIILVCRKRPADAPVCTRREFINTLKRELKPALTQLQRANIAPVDLAQTAIGPGMGVYSRFSQVLEADGTTMSVRSALQIINQELDLYFTEQDGELDRDSRFCVDLYSQYAFNDLKFGEADVLARAKNTSVEKLVGRGVLYAEKGVVHLLTREEIPAKVDHAESIIWLLTQQLTQAMASGGVVACAKIITDMFGANAEHAKALAYRLFTIAERKGWAQEAYAYNSLVIAWPEIQAKAAELQTQLSSAKQMTLFDTADKR